MVDATTSNEKPLNEVIVARCFHCQSPYYAPRTWSGTGIRPLRATCGCTGVDARPIMVKAPEPILFKRAGW
jgi:hypothetical protein